MSHVFLSLKSDEVCVNSDQPVPASVLQKVNKLELFVSKHGADILAVCVKCGQTKHYI